jgi:23S rRNA pseudouridine1911/1915/1917 synthase
LIELKLETGRTHQIRVHLSEAGFPVLGDAMYNGNKWARIQGKNLREEIAKIPRFALHAKELGFIHPRTKEAMSFKVPWPKDLQPFLKLLEFSK